MEIEKQEENNATGKVEPKNPQKEEKYQRRNILLSQEEMMLDGVRSVAKSMKEITTAILFH